MSDALEPVEFTCCECGAEVVSFGIKEAPTPPLCAHCLYIPGWQDSPALVAIIDPERGKEAGAGEPGAAPE